MIRAHVGALAVASGCVAAAACGEAMPGGGAAIAVRDSAGIEIVEHAGDVWSVPEVWQVAAEPAVSIGVADGDEPYLLDGVSGVVALADGRLVVANAGDQTLRWYDRDGTFLFQRGGKGEGPGEFVELGGITLGAADTIISVDWIGRRLTAYGADGTLGAIRRFGGIVAPTRSVFRLEDGSLVMGATGFSTAQLGDRTEPGVMRLPSPLLRLAADGSAVDTVGMFPGMEVEMWPTAGSFAIGAAPLAKSFSYAAAGRTIYVGTADRFIIDVVAPDGTLIRSIRAPDADLTISQETADAWIETRRARIRGMPPEAQPDAERSLAGRKLPETVPAYAGFLTDVEGNLWVRAFRVGSSEEPRRWAVFDPDGRMVTGIAMPAELGVMSITTDRVLAHSTDDLGVEHVVAYAIER